MFADFIDDFIGSPNPLARAKTERIAKGLPIHDYASGNVHDADIVFPQDILKGALDSAFVQAKKYAPDSKGQRVAREAIAGYYRGNVVSSSNIVVTPGTSQSYWYVFSLLANAGDEIMVPRPCYPLFEYIARLCKVQLSYYDLEVHQGEWRIDTASLSRALTPRTRAIILISPHNPTGHVLSRDEIAVIRHLACEKKIPLIIDEVFYEFVFDDLYTGNQELPQRHGFDECPLVFTLNGFSKMFALPGMKIGWIKIDGAREFVDRSAAALETIADTFLATNEIAQFAVPEIFEKGMPFMNSYKETIHSRFLDMRSLYSVAPRGGFYGVKYIGDRDEDVYALELLQQKGILVHPGYYFSMTEPSVVFSFVQGSAHWKNN